MNKLYKLIKKKKINKIISYISKKNLDINIRNKNFLYIIEYAINYNNIKFVNFLLNKNAKIDFINIEGRTIFYNIIKYKYNNILKLILNHEKLSINIFNLIDKFKNIPLHYSIIFNNYSAFKLLIDYSNINLNDLDNNNSLFYSILYNNDKFIKLICSDKYNINLNNLNNNGNSILHLACIKNFNNIEYILNKKINYDINIQQYDTRASSLIIAVLSNNNIIYTSLINYNADVNIQDNNGNTCFHYAINNNNYNFLNLYINKLKNVNVLNTQGESILWKIYHNYHQDNNLLLYSSSIIYLLNDCKLNICSNYNNNTLLYYIVINNDWKKYINILKTKKNNIFIQNNNKLTIFDIILNLKNKKKYKLFMNMISTSFINIYINKKYKYKKINLLENILKKNYTQPFLESDINDITSYIIKNKISIPLKKKKYDKKIDIFYDKIKYLPYIGISIDIIFGLLYLKSILSNIYITLTSNFIHNNQLLTLIRKNQLIFNTRGQYYNFEIFFLNNNIVFPNNFENNILKFIDNKDKYRYFIIPIAIQINYDLHSNVLIYDSLTNEMERFEPYNNIGPLSFNYNHILLDTILYDYFKIYFKKLIYFEPKKFIPNISFMMFENLNKNTYIGDPNGFCSIWCFFYIYYRIKYNTIDRKKLIKKIIKTILDMKISFKQIARSFAHNIIQYRDQYFKQISNNIEFDINDWKNNEFTNEQENKMIKIIQSLL